MITVAAVLAAGQSTRFGADDKLRATLHGQALAFYAARAVAELDVDHRIVAYRDAAVLDLFDGFDPVHVEGTQSDSLKACVSCAMQHGADRLLVSLADMPFVTTAHLEQLLSCDPNTVSASFDGEKVTVPACFPRRSLDALLDIKGDQGARVLLRSEDVVRVEAPSDVLADIDTPEMLGRYSD